SHGSVTINDPFELLLLLCLLFKNGSLDIRVLGSGLFKFLTKVLVFILKSEDLLTQSHSLL
ncbi:unnamed protein product, partial [Arabidopsis halleri]